MHFGVRGFFGERGREARVYVVLGLINIEAVGALPIIKIMDFCTCLPEKHLKFKLLLLIEDS